MGTIGGDIDDGEEEAIREVTTDQAVALIEELEITADYSFQLFIKWPWAGKSFSIWKYFLRQKGLRV